MPRLTRLRQIPSKLSSEDYVVELPKALKKSTTKRNATNKLQSTKSSPTKINSVDVLTTSRSPVLRDRTNLSKEQTANVLRKDIKNKDSDGVKMMTQIKTLRTRSIKPTRTQDTENIHVSAIKITPHSLGAKREIKPPETKKIEVSNRKPKSSIAKNEQETIAKSRVSRNLRKNEDNDIQLSLAKVSKTGSTVSMQLELPKKTRTQKSGITGNKTQSSTRNSDVKSKASKQKNLSITPKKNAEKSVKRVTRLSTDKTLNKSQKTKSGKKFFKSKLKTPLSMHSKISPLKRTILGKSHQTTVIKKKSNKITGSKLNTRMHFRQTTLRESFAKQPKKTLRPRKSLKNYCEESKLNTPKKDNEQKLENNNERKDPVYKLMNDTEEKSTDKEKIYEFVFDLNDSKERASKKRKKKVTRNPPTKKAKVTKKVSGTKSIVSTKMPAEKVDELSLALPLPVTKKLTENNVNINNVDKSNNNLKTVTVEIHSPPDNIPQPDHGVSVDEVPKSQENAVSINKPHIVSVEELKDDRRINLTVTPIQTRSNQEKSNKLSKFNLRPSAQAETMMSAPLLCRSISPIANESPKENITMNSPWRAPEINTFSRVRNVFQSTPQSKKFTRLLSKASPVTGKALKIPNSKMNKISEQNDENANISLLKESTEIIQKNTSKSPRKFGTVISNVNNMNSPLKSQSTVINSSKSPRKFGTVLSNINETSRNKSSPPIITSEQERVASSGNQSVVYDPINTSFPNNNEISTLIDESHHDKENSMPYNSVKKSPIKKLNLFLGNTSRLKNIQESVFDKTTEIIGPQAGPSGIQKLNLGTDTRNLKQSNLNSFLNLPDMPSATRITTAHGIFDDGQSEPISKIKKKEMTKDLNVENAFGFDDDCDDDNNIDTIIASPNKTSSLALNQQIVMENKKSSTATSVIQQPARFSIGEIKKALLVAKIAKDKKTDEKENTENTSINNQNYLMTTKKDVIQAISFSDTFDNLDDKEERENMKEIPLFVDLEPVHFTQPPRFSYGHKRKRNISVNTDDTEGEEEQTEHPKRTKKKKIGKAAREQKKVLDQWAKNMNSTFEEIDHFDLVVE